MIQKNDGSDLGKALLEGKISEIKQLVSDITFFEELYVRELDLSPQATETTGEIIKILKEYLEHEKTEYIRLKNDSNYKQGSRRAAY